MFSSRGLFKDVPCPGKHECTLPNCLFKHGEPSAEPQANPDTSQIYDPEVVHMQDTPPPAKRRRLDVSEPVNPVGVHIRQNSKPGNDPPEPVPKIVLSHGNQLN